MVVLSPVKYKMLRHKLIYRHYFYNKNSLKFLQNRIPKSEHAFVKFRKMLDKGVIQDYYQGCYVNSEEGL